MSIESFLKAPYPVALKPGVQHYAWGDTECIPRLLGVENPENQPYAELWMGAHPGLPAEAIIGETRVRLDALCEDAGEALLGRDVAARFGGRLPYLFKVLAAARPLSIQVHPSKSQAEDGFAGENAAGVPPGAAHRNYKDDNHKPELILAITDFYALRGFRPLEEIARLPQEVPELGDAFLEFEPKPEALKRVFGRLMTLPQERVDEVLAPLVERLRAENDREPFGEEDRRFWVLRADDEYSGDGHHDRGLFAVYLLNLVCMKPGQAAYLSAGILHAYLRGAGVELMANSDNVLRCGLTPKHIDVPELMRTVTFEEVELPLTEATRIGEEREWAYRTPAEEFELRRIEVAPGAGYRSGPARSAEILLVLDLEGPADAVLSSSGPPLTLSRGGVCLVPCGAGYTIETTEPTMIYKAVVPG